LKKKDKKEGQPPWGMEHGNPQKMGWETNSRVKVKFCFVEIQGNGKSFSTGLLTIP
jgi:hypothetical protein